MAMLAVLVLPWHFTNGAGFAAALEKEQRRGQEPWLPDIFASIHPDYWM
jgi:hypothetical protein